LIGAYAWGRRGKPGAATLALLLWLLALWGLLYAVELGARDGTLVRTLYEARSAVMVLAPPLWLVFVLRYTGRVGWLTRPFLALLYAVPVVTLALMATNGSHGLVWASERVREAGPMVLAEVVYGAWFWVDFSYGALLVLAGAGLLVSMLRNTPWLYAKQSACLLLGFVGPWAAHASYATGLDPGLRSLPNLDPAVLVFAPAGLALAWGVYRYSLLDLAPVAHDAVVEGMSDGTLVLDPQGRIVDLNPSAGRVLGCNAGEVVGKGFREVMSRQGRAAPLSGDRGTALLERYDKHGQANEEIRLGEGAEARHYDLALSALHDGRGKRTGTLVVLHEVTARKLAVEKLDKLAHYDALTGLPNRALFYERLSQEISRSRRTQGIGGGLLAVMFLDLDRFKLINDTLGHEVGDLLLRETAKRLKESVREYDVVARLAGDEFTVILPEVDSPRSATEVAGRIVRSVAAPYHLDGNELLITTSVGICFYPTDGHDPTTLVKNADAAMYRAKAGGKNRYEVYSEDALQDATKSLELENELNRAIEENQFVLHYQPEVSIATSRMVGAEALVRWQHPERGLLHPKDFVPVAEESGLIFSIERWLLREACRQMKSWQERYPNDDFLTVSVNISGRHFMHPNLSGVVGQVLEETGLPPESLVLEIKESVLHEDAASAAVTLGALKKLGVGLAVDDFGAGSSSIAELKHFPLDVLKIDSSFVRNFNEREEDRKIVSAVIGLAHALELTAVAQGVDTPRQLMQLREMGCEVAQGDYFSEPLSSTGTAAFLVADLYY
jgi:diguanylate cyclase (GGDEF)-like protein/PAS domain S-box-containing protein